MWRSYIIDKEEVRIYVTTATHNNMQTTSYWLKEFWVVFLNVQGCFHITGNIKIIEEYKLKEKCTGLRFTEKGSYAIA